jgi:hypothetical protein
VFTVVLAEKGSLPLSDTLEIAPDEVVLEFECGNEAVLNRGILQSLRFALYL